MSVLKLSVFVTVALLFGLGIHVINRAAARELKRAPGARRTETHVTLAGVLWTTAMVGFPFAGVAWATFHPSSWLGHFVELHGNGLLLLALQAPFLLLARLLARRGVVLFSKGGGGA